MARETITIEREGTFAVRWTHSHAKQCGSYGSNVFHFRVAIKGSAARMNKNGWFIDNNDIPAYFKRVYGRVRDFVSCENVVRNACRDFAAFCGKQGSHPEKITVSIQGIAGSWITCEWEG